MNNKIIVYGGTGFYGRKVVEKLVAKGQDVRVVSRSKESALRIVGDKVDIYEGDVTNRQTITDSLKGVSAIVICLSAMSNKLIRKMKAIERDAVLNIMEEARIAGISRLVYMSGYEMREELLLKLKIPEFGAVKIEVEKAIRASNFNWTILGDAPAFEIFFAFTRNGKMTVPGGGYNAIPSISPEDVGEITAQAVLRDDLGGRRIRLTGPEAFTFPQAAKQISIITGKKVKHMAIPLTLINVVSFILIPFAPFVRYLYKSLKMLNNFPDDLANRVPIDYGLLRDVFEYKSVTFEEEVKRRLESGLV